MCVSLPAAKSHTASLAMGTACMLNIEEVRGTPCYPDDTFWKRTPALAIYIPAVACAYIGIRVVTDDHLLPATERLCEEMGFEMGVVNQVFIAAGTSSAEVAALLEWALLTEDPVWVTFLVAVAIFRLLMLVGATALASPQPVHFSWPPLLRDILAAAVILATTAGAVFVPFPAANCGYWWEGLALLTLYAAYVAFMRWGNDPYLAACARRWPAQPPGAASAVEALPPPSLPTGGPLSSMDATAPAAATVTENPGRRLIDADAAAGTHTWVLARRLAAVSHTGSASAGGAPDTIETASSERGEGGSGGVSDGGGGTSRAPSTRPIRLRWRAEGLVHLGLWILSLGLKLWRLLCWPWRTLFHYTHPPVTRDDPWRHLWPLTLVEATLWVYGLMYVVLRGSRMMDCLVDIPLVNPRELLYSIGTFFMPPRLDKGVCLTLALCVGKNTTASPQQLEPMQLLLRRSGPDRALLLRYSFSPASIVCLCVIFAYTGSTAPPPRARDHGKAPPSRTSGRPSLPPRAAAARASW